MKATPRKRPTPVAPFDHERAIGLLVILSFALILLGVLMVVAQHAGPWRGMVPASIVQAGVWLMVVGAATVVCGLVLGIFLGSTRPVVATTPSAGKADWVEPPDESAPSTHLDTRRVLADLQRGKRVHRPGQRVAGAAAD